MSIVGDIKNLYSDVEKTRALFPTTKIEAVSDEDGTGLNVILDKMAYVGHGADQVKNLYADKTETQAIFPTTKVKAVSDENGRSLEALLDDKASKDFVTTKIEEAQLGGGGSGGADGFSPIATVVPTEDGALITITDKNGTTTATVKNGTDGVKGDKGDTGPQGPKGDKGDTGAAGANGADGVGISSVKQTTTSTADDGNNVITVTLTNGTTSTFKVQNGSKGSKGATGADGYTPVRGTDYWTTEDKEEIKAYVEEAILGGAW